ncbi:hypothetical protein [Halomonas alimentaria]|uniref:hypothetical protein n=1 Tax=Halomonas alimentaria TaxID=147248 RepID=UPI00197ADC7B|nr:hypothetical protein [Halomonas alimentaria]
MIKSVEAFPAIWDRSGTSRRVVKPLLRGVWRGMIKLAEAQCAAHARRGFMPHV